MSLQRWHAAARYIRRLGATAALLTVSLSPQGPARAEPNGEAAAAAATGSPYTLSLAGLQRSGDTLIPDLLGMRASSIRAMACLPPDVPISMLFGDPGTAKPRIRGGDTLLMRAGALPPHRTFALLLDIPRARSSANLRVPIRYSPPAVTAVSDANGKLVDAQGSMGVRVMVPGDASSGAGTISLLEQGSSWQQVQAVLVAPQPPAVEIHALNALGQPAPGAEVRFEGAGGVRCAARTDVHGNLLLTHVPAGAASLSVQRGAEELGVFHPDPVPGQTIVLQAPSVPKSGPVVVTAHSDLNCDKKTGFAYALRDSASGLATAASGNGPFGVFIADIVTNDTFTAHLTSQAADGSLGPIAHDAPIAVKVIMADNTTVPVHSTVGSDVPGGDPSGPAGYTNVTFRIDPGALPAGKNSIEIDVGAPSSYCMSLYDLSVASNPTTTPLGTIDSYFDPATNSYQIDGVLPTNPKLWFHKSLPFSLPAGSVGDAQMPSVPAQEWVNEGQIGLDVHETIRTDGSWSGTVGGHARLVFFNYTLVNEELPALQGSGPNIHTGSMARTIHLGGKSIDTSLYNYLVVVPGLGIIIVVNLRFNATGNVDAEVGVPPTLNQAYFTIAPTATASIIGSATLPTFFLGSFSAELSGSVGLAAPVTLRVPGGPEVRIGMLVSATAKFGSPIGSTSVQLLPPQCSGSCGPAPQSVRTDSGAVVVSTLAENTTQTLSSAPQSGPQSAVNRVVPVHLVLQAVKTAPDAQPATALAPDGTPATLWVSTRRDGTLALRAQVGHAAPRTLATNAVALAAPQVAWIGPRRALAVWMASTASPGDVAQLQSALPSARKELLWALVARQQLFSSQWDGNVWSAPAMITDGMALNAEPSLAGDAATGRAVLAWVRGPLVSKQPDSLSGLNIASRAFARGVWSTPTTVSTASEGAVNAPSVALDSQDRAGVAWLDGPLGIGQAMVSRRGAAGWTAPAPVAGLSGSAQRIALAFDAHGRMVVAEEAAQALFGARLEADAHWSIWNLGSGSMPQLVRGAASGVVLLAERPVVTQASRLSYHAILTVLDETGWSPRTRMTSDLTAQAGEALAVDSATGKARVVLGARPSAPYAATDGLMDHWSPLLVLEIPVAGAAALTPESITLSAPHPAPGAPITVDVRLRNLATMPVAAGVPVHARMAFLGRVLSVTVRTPHAIPAYAEVTLHIPLTAPAAPIVGTVAAGHGMLSATLGLPGAPRNVAVASKTGLSGALVEWEASADKGITGYRVYRVSAKGALALIGLAHDTTWVDPWAAGSGQRYAVTAVDTEGRESPATTSS